LQNAIWYDRKLPPKNRGPIQTRKAMHGAMAAKVKPEDEKVISFEAQKAIILEIESYYTDSSLVF
jgi:hypothetical protein